MKDRNNLFRRIMKRLSEGDHSFEQKGVGPNAEGDEKNDDGAEGEEGQVDSGSAGFSGGEGAQLGNGMRPMSAMKKEIMDDNNDEDTLTAKIPNKRPLLPKGQAREAMIILAHAHRKNRKTFLA